MRVKYYFIMAFVAFVSVHFATLYDKNSVVLAVGGTGDNAEPQHEMYETNSENDEAASLGTEFGNNNSSDELWLKDFQIIGGPESSIEHWQTINFNDESGVFIEETSNLLDELFVFTSWVECKQEGR